MELSAKESKAKEAEKNYKQKTHAALGFTEDGAVQNLRDPSNWKKQE